MERTDSSQCHSIESESHWIRPETVLSDMSTNEVA
jgi:hypothetical protein